MSIVLLLRPSPAGPTPLYKGIAGQAVVYLGATAVASKYLGPNVLFP